MKKSRLKVRMLTHVFIAIMKTLVSFKPEKGGYLFGDPSTLIIQQYVCDEKAPATYSSFDVRPEFINPIIKEYWEKFGLALIGIIHSHPGNFSQLSSADITYFTALLPELKSIDQLIVPIVHSAVDRNGFEIFPYVIDADGHIELAELELLPDNYQVNSAVTIPNSLNESSTPEPVVPSIYLELLTMLLSQKFFRFWLSALLWAVLLLVVLLLPVVLNISHSLTQYFNYGLFSH